MKVFIKPSPVAGAVLAPASKSAMQRACAAALLKGGTTILHNPGISNDDKAALNIIQQLGAEVTKEVSTIGIKSAGVKPVHSTLNCGESGLSVRMFTPIAALSSQLISITGSGSLLRRPLQFFDALLPQLQVRITSNGGLLPLEIQGPLRPKNISVDGSLSSQFLTGLLMAFSAAGAADVTIHVAGLNSKPYIDLTLQVMKDFGLAVPVHDNYTSFHFGARQRPVADNKPFHYSIEGDWSGAAFLLTAGAITKSLQPVAIKGLNIHSTQADKAFIQALVQAEAKMSITEETIEIAQSRLKAFHFNATDCPDLFPPLVALASYCEGTSVIEGVHRLTHKESNRALTLQQEFEKMGVEVVLQDDVMIVKNNGVIKGALVNSHHDHRIAMACAVAGLNATEVVSIENAEAVNKSYPQFWTDISSLGAVVFHQD